VDLLAVLDQLAVPGLFEALELEAWPGHLAEPDDPPLFLDFYRVETSE
jgi:hypothetical protein